MALYLHFLDRELIEAVKWSPTSSQIHRAVRAATLFAGEDLYSGLSALWENPLIGTALRDELAMLVATNQLHLVSRERTADEFLASRQELYAHDQERYPLYYQPPGASPLAALQPEWRKARGSTAALHEYMSSQGGKMVALPPTTLYTRLGQPILDALRERDGRAVTIALFRPHLRLAGLDARPEAEGMLARIISAGYSDDYVEAFGGDLMTGINPLSAYTLAGSTFPDFDLELWLQLAAFLGVEELLDPAVTDLTAWAAYIAQRGDPPLMRLALEVRALLRGLHRAAAETASRRAIHPYEASAARADMRNAIQKAIHRRDFLVQRHPDDPDAVATAAWQHLRLLGTRLAEASALVGRHIETVREEMHVTDRKTDLLLVTVNEIETEALRAELEQLAGPAESYFGAKLTYWDYRPVAGVRVSTLRSGMGSNGVHGSTLTVSEAVAEREPSSVVAVGVAFGTKFSQPIGQLLLSERLSAYDAQRVSTGPGGEPVVIRRGPRTECSARLLSTFRDARLGDIGIEVAWGEMVSGAALIDNPTFKAQLLTDYPEAIGGEMEGAGVQAAADREHTDWIVAKAVCDYAESKGIDKEARQRLAAAVSARAVAHTLVSGAFTARSRRGRFTP